MSATPTLALLAMLAVLVTAGSAEAAFEPHPGQRETKDRRVLALRDLAVDYWRERDVEMACAPVAIDAADSLGGPFGVAWHPSIFGGTCRVAILRDDVEQLRRAERRARRSRWGVRVARFHRVNLCSTIVHELGHIGGLALPRFDRERWEWVDGHPTERGVMSNVHSAVPEECRAEARSAIRKPKPRRRR